MLETDEHKEIKSLAESFESIISTIGLSNPYEPIDYEVLPDDIKHRIDGLNLELLLRNQLGKDEIDIPTTKFLINETWSTKKN